MKRYLEDSSKALKTPLYEGARVSAGERGWLFWQYCNEKCICLPPGDRNGPLYEPLLGCKEGNMIVLKDTLVNSSQSLHGAALQEEVNSDHNNEDDNPPVEGDGMADENVIQDPEDRARGTVLKKQGLHIVDGYQAFTLGNYDL